jgi:hypothetical protein
MGPKEGDRLPEGWLRASLGLGLRLALPASRQHQARPSANPQAAPLGSEGSRGGKKKKINKTCVLSNRRIFPNPIFKDLLRPAWGEIFLRTFEKGD